MPDLNVGDAAPDFSAPTEAGGRVTLSELSGPVVLFFYPKDDTSGCTKEAIGFSEARPSFDALGVTVLGVSVDNPASHDRFVAKHGLSVSLVSDEDKAIVERYGVWVEKSMYGRTFMGTERATFLLDADKRIAAVWRKVRVPGHVEAVLKAAGQSS